MQQNKKEQSRILIQTVIDARDELDERLERCYGLVNSIVCNLSEKQINDALNAYVCKGQQQHEEIQLGLFYMILVDQKQAPRAYRDLMLVARDGLNVALTNTNRLIHEKWLKLQDLPRQQVLWFCKELVKNNVMGADSVVNSLLRQIAGGDTSVKNVWLAESVLDMLAENRPWLEKWPSLLATVMYCYLRIIIDHGAPHLGNLRQKEVEFCVGLLRDKWNDCMQLGRDLVRVLQYVARIPEFDKLWNDILNNPTVLSPQFTGVAQLMQIRTSRKFLVSRLTPEMELKLTFLMTKVKFGNQKRYQDWFQRQYLSTPESQSLRCDLIRFICAVVHPSNELLQSDVTPRWAVIGWLLTTCTSNVAASNAKLSLFYDWLFFDRKDSIMNIEPCILVMFHSIRPHPAITATLLDFMCRIMSNFCPALTPQVKQGIYTSLRTITEKRVLQNLSPLFDNPKLDKELRSMLRENFREFCTIDGKEELNSGNSHENMDMESVSANNHHPPPLNHSDSIPDAEFSEDEDDVPLGRLKTDMKFRPIKETKHENVDITEHLEQLDGDIKQCVVDMQNEMDNEIQCEIMERLMQAVVQDEDFEELATPLATCLCSLLASQFNNNLFPQSLDDESIEDSIGSPVFVMFRILCQTPEEDPSRQPMLMLIGEMYNRQPRIGYYLLYYLKVGKIVDEKWMTYKEFCKSLENRDIESVLMADLRLCQEDDVRLFTYLIPQIYTQFPNIAIGSSDLLLLIVSSIDGTQLQDLICQILQGHLIMFRKDSFLSILNASLDWETIEQYFLWQLIAAHNIPVEHIMPILPKLEFQAHAEALTSILVQLKQDCPSADLLRPILCRECKKNDFFTVSILKYWAQEYEDKLADLLLNQMTKLNQSTPTRKRSRTNANAANKKENPSVEQVLSHLDHMRQTCRNISFLTHESLQQALQNVQSTSSESTKTKYSDLLALAEDFEDMKTTRVLRGGRKGSTACSSPKQSRNKKSPVQAVSESSSESSEDEELVKPKPKKRKKATNIVEDDSD